MGFISIRHITGILCLGVCLLVGAQVARADAADLVKDALDLVYSGRSEDAYQLLVVKEDEFAGERDFDYALGLAAVDSGRFAMAIFALQRVIAVDPLFSGARMELARAYVEIKEYEHAEKEFAILLTQDPPEKIIDAIARYQARIRAETRSMTATAAWYFDATMGQDSNINTATEDRFGPSGIPLDEHSRSTESAYFAVTGGGQYIYPLAGKTLLMANANIGTRKNVEAAFLDTLTANVAVAGRRLLQTGSVQIVADWGRMDVDGEENNTRTGMSAEWQKYLNQQNVVALNSSFSSLRYAEAVRIRDIDQVLYGFQYTYITGTVIQSSYGFLVNAGRDFAADKESMYERDITAAQVFGRWAVTSGFSVNLSMSGSRSEYAHLPPLLASLGERTDIRREAMAGVQWKLTPTLHLNSMVRWSNQSSPVNIYDYARTEFSIGLRWNFPATNR